jgi:nicotinic acid mononucleotide adenylyltransferase
MAHTIVPMGLSAKELARIAARLEALDSQDRHAVMRFDRPRAPGPRVVLPSAFNPPTEAHLALMTLAADLLESQPAALLTTRNVAKGVEGAPLEDRVGMLLAARTEQPRIAVLVANAARFVDQARALRTAYRSHFDFVAGYDTLIRIFDRRYYEDMERELAELFAHHRLVATNRADAGIDEVRRFVRDRARAYAERIIPLEVPAGAASLSSTAARESAGAEIAGVPPAVTAYIRARGLYASPPGPLSTVVEMGSDESSPAT